MSAATAYEQSISRGHTIPPISSIRLTPDQIAEYEKRLSKYTEIAKLSGVSLSHVSRILRGKSSPRLSTLRKIAHAVGMSINELDIYLQYRISHPINNTYRVSRPPNAKLSVEKARTIRADSDRLTIEEQAEIYGVSKQAISDVLRGNTYRES